MPIIAAAKAVCERIDDFACYTELLEECPVVPLGEPALTQLGIPSGLANVRRVRIQPQR